MILHVSGLDKFIPAFVGLIQKEFKDGKHEFWLTDYSQRYKLDREKNIYISGRGVKSQFSAYVHLVVKLHRSKKVILHGLNNYRLLVVLAFFPWILPKCYWVIWGADLYQYTSKNSSWASRFKEALRSIVIRRIGHLVTYIEGDVELARQWYGAKGKHHECIMYLSNVVDPKMIMEPDSASDHDGLLNILLGNSADPSNNHIEALERLLPFNDQSLKIYAPLSYGDQNHAKKVISQGKAWFGDKFVPMTDFMPFEQYLEFLKILDIAIFNHQRQQAMGNTITLLGMGKTVFMRSDVSHWRFLKGLGIKLNDVEKLELGRITPKDAEENARVIRSYFSRENLIRQLNGVLEE